MPSLVVRNRKNWTVKCPPLKKHMVAGKLMPTVRGAFGMSKTRRVCIEIQGTVSAQAAAAHHMPISHKLPTTVDQMIPGDHIVLRILKPRKHWGLSRDYEEDTDDENDEDHDEENADWVEYRKFDLDDIEQDSMVVGKNSFEAQMGRGGDTEVRELNFETAKQAQEFVADLKRLHALRLERAQTTIKAFQAQKKVEAADAGGVLEKLSSTIGDEDVNLLVEIVSATDLPIADMKSTDPYVAVWLGKNKVHKTAVISNTCDPIWAVDTQSLFILSATSHDFFHANAGLTFTVKDHDTVGKNDALGKVSISQKELLEAKGERVEYELEVLVPGYNLKKVVFPPKLNVRVRPATKKDFKFVKTLFAVKSKKTLGVYADVAFVAPLPHTVNRLKRETKKTENGPLHRVKPGPDPDREESLTKWLSDESIKREHLGPSTRWIETGSGKVGRLYFEVLRCDDLPNLDTGAMGDKTDAFCSVIYEDAVVNTDVINDELSPRWMPWSQRAFLFHIQHPSSQVLVGVFDYDNMRSDPIGRVTIDITNFKSNTDYVLTYTLYASILDEIRKPKGTLTVRIRLDMNNFSRAAMASLRPPRANYVNMAKKDDFRSARFVTQGEENLHNLDMEALKSYGVELQGYADAVYYIKQAVMIVVLWRGHYQVKVCRCKCKLPLHSVVAFVMGISLAENLDLLPSFIFLSIAWFFLATNQQRQRNPSPWHKSATFGGMWLALITGRPWGKPIVSNDAELEPLIKEYAEEQEARRKSKEEKKEKSKTHLSLMDAYFAQEEKEAVDNGAEEIETKTGGAQLNPLKPILLPIQKILGMACRALRIVKSIVLWDESIYAFMITNAALFIGVVLIFMPWSWLLRWAFRVAVWTFLGPWMKLVDIFVVRKLQADGDNFVKRMELSMEKRSQVLLMKKRFIMTRKEDAIKLRAMKRYMFGKYIAKVPQFKDYRFPDIPLPESSSSPHDAGYSSVKIVERKHGQQLDGHMIPAWGDVDDSEILNVKATTQSDTMLSRASPMRMFQKKKAT